MEAPRPDCPASPGWGLEDEGPPVTLGDDCNIGLSLGVCMTKKELAGASSDSLK